MQPPPLYSSSSSGSLNAKAQAQGPVQGGTGPGRRGLLSICQRLEVWLTSPEFPKVNPLSKRNVVEMHRSGCLLKEIYLQIILCYEKSPPFVSVERIHFPSLAPFIIKNHHYQVISSIAGHEGFLCHLKLRESYLLERGLGGGGGSDGVWSE